MSANHDYILRAAREHCPPPAALLDFGCGAGEVVSAALAAGYDAWGTDTYAGGWQQYAAAGRTSLGSRLRVSAADDPYGLPFEDGRFDVVVSNQVFEHIADPMRAARSLHRVLKPGGRLIALFPTRDVVIEPHLKTLPWVHRLPTGSRLQLLALRLSHRLGMSCSPREAPGEFAAGAVEALRRDIHYVPARDIPRLFHPWFRVEARLEPDYLRYRMALSMPAAARLAGAVLADPVLRFLCLRLAGCALVLRREPGPPGSA